MEVIRIADGVVTLSEETVIRRVRLDAFKDRLAVGLKLQTPVLPRGTVLYAARSSKSLLVLEEAPQSRSITFRDQLGRARDYSIPLPWVYFMPVFHGTALESLYVYFAKDAVKSPSSPLCFPALPNTFDDCKVCLGDYRYSVTSALAARIADISRFYWASTFNLDASSLYTSKMPEAITSASPPGASLFEGWMTFPQSSVCELSWARCDSVESCVASALY